MNTVKGVYLLISRPSMCILTTKAKDDHSDLPEVAPDGGQKGSTMNVPSQQCPSTHLCTTWQLTSPLFSLGQQISPFNPAVLQQRTPTSIVFGKLAFARPSPFLISSEAAVVKAAPALILACLV
jgi:hypothetical protein